MKFCVDRTSQNIEAVPPCEGAQRASVLFVDSRYVDDPAKVRLHQGETAWWYEQGSNHRVEQGYIKRDMGYVDVWIIDIESLEELVDLANREGQELIVSGVGEGNYLLDGKPLPSIEIYDDYRE